MNTSKFDQAYDYIKKRILNGTFPPQSDISDDALQKELQVSNTPIRNALLQLERERFVNIYPQKGTFVAAITIEDILQVYEVRQLIEPHIVEQMAESLTEEQRLVLEQFKVDFQNPPASSEKEVRNYYIDLDRALHQMFFHSSKNVFLISTMKNVLEFDQFVRIPTSMRNPEYDINIEEHLEIVEAILAKDSAGAKKALEDHIIHSKESTLTYVIGRY